VDVAQNVDSYNVAIPIGTFRVKFHVQKYGLISIEASHSA